MFARRNADVNKTYLHHEVSTTEICDRPGKACPSPHEPEEEGALGVGEGLHHLPEPLDQRGGGLHSLIRGYRLEQVKRDIGAAAHLQKRPRRIRSDQNERFLTWWV